MKKRGLFSVCFIIFAILTIIACGSETAVQKAKAHYKNGNIQEMINVLENEVKKHPSNRDANYYLGIGYLNIGRFDEAGRIFYSAIESKEDPEKKAFLKNEIAREYREVFFRYLSSPNQIERKSAGMLLKYALTLNGSSDFVKTVKDKLMSNGVQFLNNHSLEIADDHFDHLLTLDNSVGKEIADAYLVTYKKIGNLQSQTHIVNQIVKYSDNEEYQKTYSDHYYNLSQKAETTERAVVYLEIANKFGNMYSSKLIAKKQQLKLERMLELVEKIEIKLGKANKVTVDKLGEIVASGKYGNHFELYYLSLEEFNICFNNKEKKKYRASFDDYNMHELSDKNNIEIGFEMLTQPTVIYYWVRNL